MPFTPYHFGPSGFLGLLLRKWIDLPVFLLTNVIVDIEVLFFHRLPVHRYAHTFLIGGVLGVTWAIAAYPLRHLFGKVMRLLRLRYKPGFFKMVVSGVLGVWLHVLIDGMYHSDVRLFWPNKKISLWRTVHAYVTTGHIEMACAVFIVAAVTLYVWIVNRPSQKKECEVITDESESQ